jgi:hypothetical protein
MARRRITTEKGGALFASRSLYGGYDGGEQSMFVVPCADLVRV